MNTRKVTETLELLGTSFEPFLSASNPVVVASLRKLGHDDDHIRRTELFDWFQGVGLYGYYELYKLNADDKYLRIMLDYFETRLADGLPEKNINSMAPMLTLISLLAEGYISDDLSKEYWEVIESWAGWLYEEAPRTEGGGFSHLTCEASNAQEMWDDTLFMAVLFLGKAGIVLERSEYVEEAVFQFLTHNQYLQDSKTGFWFHGYTFEGQNNFIEARWARGNSWITLFVPLFLEICREYPLSSSLKRIMEASWLRQVEMLIQTQKPEGLWSTLLDDADSYGEASATAGFLWGIIKGCAMNMIECDGHMARVIEKGIEALLENVNDSGELEQVSGGTAMGKDSLDFYRDIPLVPKPYGQAMAMGALGSGMNLFEDHSY